MNDNIQRTVGGESDGDPAVTETDAEGEPDARAESQSGGTADGAVDETRSRALPLDETFELLRNQRRRYVLQYLASAEGEVSLGELAEQIAAWENDKTVREVTSGERKRVYVGLYQCHLPKMDGMDVVSFNKPRGLIERGPNVGAVEAYLEREDSEDRSQFLGFAAGLAVATFTLVPLAIVLATESLALLLAALVVVVLATGGGLVFLRESRSTEE